MPKAKNVTVIPATLNIHTKTPATERVRRRVAAYARVSTDSEEQLTSYEAQVDYYTKFIQENPDWDFVEVYTDEGISAVNTKHCDGFNRMIRDALAGKIDPIVTKSVSRFARNTVDSLTTIRKLKEAGCECFFQKENIMTFDSKGELLITIMSSLAQEESRSISENVTWGQRKRFADGKVSIPYGQFLGYRKGADGLPEIVPEEAEIVRRIYREFLQGKSTNAIAAMLTEEGIPTPSKRTVWQRATVESILRNEKYKGSALLQKSFTVDFLTKKTKVNEGEVPQYYVEDSHPAIIEPWEWEQVQTELERRKSSRNRHRQTSPFSGKILCADCGGIFGAKTWNSTDRYRRVVWQCNDKFKGGTQMRNAPSDRGTVERILPVGPWGISFRPGEHHCPAARCPAGAYGYGFYRRGHSDFGRGIDCRYRNAAPLHRRKRSQYHDRRNLPHHTRSPVPPLRRSRSQTDVAAKAAGQNESRCHSHRRHDV